MYSKCIPSSWEESRPAWSMSSVSLYSYRRGPSGFNFFLLPVHHAASCSSIEALSRAGLSVFQNLYLLPMGSCQWTTQNIMIHMCSGRKELRKCQAKLGLSNKIKKNVTTIILHIYHSDEKLNILFLSQIPDNCELHYMINWLCLTHTWLFKDWHCVAQIVMN